MASEERTAAVRPPAPPAPWLVPAGDRDYDQARRAWNLIVDQRPAAVALPASAAEVADAVRYARQQGLRVAPQSTGHSAGLLGDLSGTLLLRTDRLQEIQIDPVARVARVGAGVVWADAVRAAGRHGLATLAGTSPDVGVVGYTLGGGLSFLGRKYGFASNSVIAIEAVTADGRQVRASATSEAELFWALRGGGGSFAVVTAMEFRLLPVPLVYAGALWYPASRGAEVLHSWARLTRGCYGEIPDELTTLSRFLNLPAIPDVPQDIRGKSFCLIEVCHAGDPAEADQLLAPLRALGPVNDTIELLPTPGLLALHMDPEHPVPGAGDGMTLDDLPPEAVDAFLATAGPGAPFRLMTAEIRHLGGALGRDHGGHEAHGDYGHHGDYGDHAVREAHGALSSVDARYAVHMAGMVPVPDLVLPTMMAVESVKEALAPWAARQSYLNFCDTWIFSSLMWSLHTYHELRRIKTKVDPGNVIRANHPIVPWAHPIVPWEGASDGAA